MGKPPKYFIVEASALPEIFRKGAEGKRGLGLGVEGTVHTPAGPPTQCVRPSIEGLGRPADRGGRAAQFGRTAERSRTSDGTAAGFTFGLVPAGFAFHTRSFGGHSPVLRRRIGRSVGRRPDLPGFGYGGVRGAFLGGIDLHFAAHGVHAAVGARAQGKRSSAQSQTARGGLVSLLVGAYFAVALFQSADGFFFFRRKGKACGVGVGGGAPGRRDGRGLAALPMLAGIPRIEIEPDTCV